MKSTKKCIMLSVVFSMFVFFAVQGQAAEVLYVPFDTYSSAPGTTVYLGNPLHSLLCQFQNGQTPVAGIIGNAFQFNGSCYITVPDDPMLNFGIYDFAITFWVKTTSTKGNNAVIEKRNAQDVGYHVAIYNGRPLLRMHGQVGTGFNYWGGTSSVAVNDGKWHYVAIYVQRNNPVGGKIYIDGLTAYTFNPTSHQGKSLDNTEPLYIGKHRFTSNYNFDGTLDELRLFRPVFSK